MVKLWTQPSHSKLAPHEVAKEGRDNQRGIGHVRVGVAGRFTVNEICLSTYILSVIPKRLVEQTHS